MAILNDFKKWVKVRLARGEFKLSIHAVERMAQRLVFESDIKACGRTCKKIEYQESKKSWKVIGKDLDGYKLTVICSVKDGVLIVTVY